MRIIYHKDVGFPSWLRQPKQTVKLCHTLHSQLAIKNDRYGEVRKFTELDLSKNEIIEAEVETKSRTIEKLVVRGSYSPVRDVVHVIVPSRISRDWVVKTVWSNLVADRHKTLDKSKYAKV